MRIGAAVPQDTENSMEVQGQDQVTGLPRPITLTTGEIVEALQEPLREIDLGGNATGDRSKQEAGRDDADVDDGLMLETEAVGELDDDVHAHDHGELPVGQEGQPDRTGARRHRAG